MHTPRSRLIAHLFFGFALLAALLGAAIRATPVRAATLTVTNTNDSLFYGNAAAEGGGAIVNFESLTINDSTFSGNSSPVGGGAITNLDSLTVNDSTFSDNLTSGGNGAAIASNGTLMLSDSTLARNVSTEQGGGLFVIGGTASITGSTFSDNSAEHAGGIYSLPGTTIMVANSTFSGNTASSMGGGVYNDGTATFINSTFSGNVADDAGGIFNAGTLNYANTIIANSAGGDCVLFLGSSIGTNTNNLVEDGSCSPAFSGDPSLDSLGDNSGPTQTIALLPGSTALDAGNSTTCAASPVNNSDQRGRPRPINTTCDIGVYEADYLVVTKAADTNDGTCDSDCSLREAIAAADASADLDAIRFNGNYTITLASALSSTLPNGFTEDDLMIDGKGYNVVIDGNGSDRIIETHDNFH
ncbi:MAG TPA: choice-of-anchor Q domain-containing protein, partial [Roseiflexaceae bacterium]|nr:choice-of-anchor Q domain-containing protein [Roseiflexaceae bacterium]